MIAIWYAVKHWISGRWASSSDGATAESVNPANGETLGSFCAGGLKEAEAAVVAGCTSVVKAAPQTALFNARVFALLAEVNDLPDGAVNMFVETGSEGAKHLVSSVDVDVISYTGSTEVGKQIMAAGATTLKRMNLELGGNAPLVLLPDTDLEFAVNAICRAGTMMTGQYCCSAAHVLVHESRLDESLSRFADRLQSINVGPGINQESEMGPMIDAAGRERVCRHHYSQV